MSAQLVTPNPNTQDYAGYCLRFAQSVWGAPVRYKSAWDAWNATQLKHSVSDPVPNDVGTLQWFSHWGTYGYYDNWGHVVSFIPSRGYLSSPLSGYGQSWFDTIEEVERAFNAKYVGWSEDINGLRVVEISKQPVPPQPPVIPNDRIDTMNLCHVPQADGTTKFVLFNDAFYLEFVGQEAANAFASQIGGSSAGVSQSFLDLIKAQVSKNQGK
jgi:hypothetical protein